MNVDNVYLCKIYMITEIDLFALNKYWPKTIYRYCPKDSLKKIPKIKSIFIKDAMVVRISSYRYRDLSTGDEYYVGTDCFRDHEGTLYISTDERPIPFAEKISVEENNMSKRKILKKYHEYQYQNQTKEKE